MENRDDGKTKTEACYDFSNKAKQVKRRQTPWIFLLRERGCNVKKDFDNNNKKKLKTNF